MTEYKTLYEALAAVQTSIEQPKKDAKNPKMNSGYVTLDAVVECINNAVRKSEAKIFWTNQIIDNVMYTVLLGYDDRIELRGSKIAVDMSPVNRDGKKVINNAQEEGSAITYARRYSLSMAFGIASEADDDAAAVRSYNQNNNRQNKSQQQRNKPQQNQMQNAHNQTQNAHNQTQPEPREIPKSRKIIFNNIVAEIAKKQNVPLEQISSEITNYCKSLPEMAGADKNKAWDILIKHAERVLDEPILVEG